MDTEMSKLAEDHAGGAGQTPAGGRTEIKTVVERAVTDPDFKRQLLEDPDAALEGYDLTEVQTLLIRSLDASDLAKLTPENLDEYFSTDAAVYTPADATDVQRGYEMYEASEIEREASSRR